MDWKSHLTVIKYNLHVDLNNFSQFHRHFQNVLSQCLKGLGHAVLGTFV